MTRTVYVNGRYLPYGQAAVHVEDRGFQLADSVYEVCAVQDGRLLDETRHLARLERSLTRLGMAMPASAAALRRIIREVVRRNRVHDGIVYLQVSRGVARREFLFPDAETPPTLVCLARSQDLSKLEAAAQTGIAVVTLPDERWARVDIKTTQLLAPVLAKEAARKAGAKEAWLVDRAGLVTEGASSNAWIVTAAGRLVTRSLDGQILPGVTRSVVVDLAARLGLGIEERAFSVEEARAATEAFLTSASNLVMPVTRIDGSAVGDGKPGHFSLQLRSAFLGAAEQSR
ncbi:MAG: D-amino-acid transaminase [Hyphomicrobiaceae bacterium]